MNLPTYRVQLKQICSGHCQLLFYSFFLQSFIFYIVVFEYWDIIIRGIEAILYNRPHRKAWILWHSNFTKKNWVKQYLLIIFSEYTYTVVYIVVISVHRYVVYNMLNYTKIVEMHDWKSNDGLLPRKAEFKEEGTFFANIFPSLGNSVNKELEIEKTMTTFVISVLKILREGNLFVKKSIYSR